MTEATHGNLLVVNGVGVLLTGEAGSGKSEISLELIMRGHQLVADDVVLIERSGNVLTGRAPDRFAGLIAVRDVGIIDIRRLFSDRSLEAAGAIEVSVELTKVAPSGSRIHTGGTEIEICGVKLPHFVLTVRPGRNLAMLVELVSSIVSSPEDTEREAIAGHDAAVNGTIN